MRVLVTGASGKCGTALADLEHDTVFVDREERAPALPEDRFVRGDIVRLPFLENVMRGVEAVVHLAIAWPSGGATWDELLLENTRTTLLLLSTANRLNVDRVIYASSNHVVGMYEIDHAPGIYEANHPLKVDHTAPARPDSLYGLSKAMDEDAGRYYADHGGPRFYAVRIGAVLPAGQDHPYAYGDNDVRDGKCRPGDDAYRRRVNRLKSIWCSRRDFAHLVDLCLRHPGEDFDIFYGVSDNDRRWLDIERAKSVLGYRPLDNAERFTASPDTGRPS